jgi:hypothetical protein
MLQRKRRVQLRERLAAGARLDEAHAADPLRDVAIRQSRRIRMLRFGRERAHERAPRELAHRLRREHPVRRRIERWNRREVRGHLAEQELVDVSRERAHVERFWIVARMKQRAETDDRRDSGHESSPPQRTRRTPRIKLIHDCPSVSPVSSWWRVSKPTRTTHARPVESAACCARSGSYRTSRAPPDLFPGCSGSLC